MSNKFTLIIIFAVVLLLDTYSRVKKNTDDENLTKYRSNKNNASLYEKKMLLTKPEYYFWKKLKTKCDEKNIIICPKVRMEDFTGIKTNDKATRQKYRGYIKSRHIDFILCDSNLNMIAGIELDDNSHKQSNAQKVDSLKNDVFEAINIPLFRVKTNSKTYDEEINEILRQLFKETVSEVKGK